MSVPAFTPLPREDSEELRRVLGRPMDLVRVDPIPVPTDEQFFVEWAVAEDQQ